MNGVAIGDGNLIDVVGAEVVGKGLNHCGLSIEDVLDAHKVSVFEGAYFREGGADFEFGESTHIDFTGCPDAVKVCVAPFKNEVAVG